MKEKYANIVKATSSSSKRNGGDGVFRTTVALKDDQDIARYFRLKGNYKSGTMSKLFALALKEFEEYESKK